MRQTPANLLVEFTSKLDELKSKSLKITSSYQEKIDEVKHHVQACRLKHKPVNLNILSSYPDSSIYIAKIIEIEDQVLKLRNNYFGLLNQSK